MLEEAKNVIIGKSGGNKSIFVMMVGKGSSSGSQTAQLLEQIEKLAVDMEDRRVHAGCDAASGERRTFRTSGHLPYYKESMYPP